MAIRSFDDEQGRAWRAWCVIPGTPVRTERRTGTDRRSPDPVLAWREAERRAEEDRRRTHRLVAPEYRKGWLAFESGGERRRMVPVPPGWDELPDAELAALCHRAEVIAVTDRRLAVRDEDPPPEG
ncbi:MAG TPA: hypothetical protein VFH27_03850 [Longimicrobiaceae bacterium]|nr:hypothetical protein [Longimicrobiaceae bacterium]